VKLPWQPEPDELFALRGHGGQTFSDFVSALLRAEGSLRGLPATDVNTSTRVNIADGGVDAEVRSPLGGPLELAFPTCWQFKATLFSDFDEKDLSKEANKPEAKRLISAGYGYYVCVCDDWPPNKMGELDAVLREIVRGINPNAPVPRVLNAGHLADWSRHHAGIVRQFFRPHLGEALAYEAWQRKERAALPTFVELPARSASAEKIRAFVAGEQAARPILSIRGASGAGVSRLVAETLSEIAERVVYVPDPGAAVALIISLVNQRTATGVVVIDRCNRDVRIAVEDLLKAEVGRLRALVIQDGTEPSSDVSITLPTLEDADVERVIDANFSAVPSLHRRGFVHFADGALKIAAQLATSYGTNPSRFLVDSASWAHDELRRLVRDDTDRDVVQAISLFKRVGYKGDVSGQLDEVCRLFNLARRDVLQRCSRLSESPGVVALGSRYLTVRPRLFARPLFAAAWVAVVADDVNSFLDRLPIDLHEPLLKQAAQHAPKAARDALADWAAPWTRKLVPSDLGIASVLERLLPLVEVCPTRLAPRLSDLVERQSDEEARTVGELFEHWPARTHVIWVLRQLLERRDTHELAERALFRLARAEGDAEGAARQSSTATQTWGASFRLFLSGTEVAFKERLSLLEAKLDRFGSDAIPLVIVGLGFALDSHASKTEGLPVISGEVRPPDWQPRTYQELWDGLDEALSLLGRCLLIPTHRAFAFKTFVRHGRGLLRSGRFEALRAALQNGPLGEPERVAVLGIVDDYLGFDASRDGEDDRYPSEYVQAVKDWHQTLKRTDLSGRVLEVISSSSYRRQVDEKDAWLSELRGLSAELLAARADLEKLLPSLVDGDHHGGAVFEFGRALAGCDTAGTLIALLFSLVRTAENPLLVRGYIVGLMGATDVHDALLKRELDALEDVSAEMAVDLNGMSARLGSAGARAIRLVRARRLQAEILTTVWSVRFEGELLAEALEATLEALHQRPEDAAATALKILGPLAWDAKTKLPQDERTLSAIWRALETAIDGAHAEAHSWGRVLRRLSEVDFERAVRLASCAIVRGDLSIDEEAACELSVYIGKDPTFVLKTLGPMLLAPENSWRLLLGKRGVLLNSFPEEILRQWVSENGVEAARIVAPQMSAPHMDAEGNAVVPPLTAFILDTFENDDRVFLNFCAGGGGHNGQMYRGDIAGQHEKEAELAEKFRTHSLRRIREWAEQEEGWARRSAQRWREHDEEEFDE